MNRLIFEISWFLISKVQSIWAQMFFKYIVRIAKHEWIEAKIEKHERFANDLRAMLDAEAFISPIQPGHQDDSAKDER